MTGIKSERNGFLLVLSMLVAGQIAELLVSRQAAMAINDVSQLFGGLLAFAVCVFRAADNRGWQRTWRALMALGMLGWSAGQATWSWAQVVERREIPSPSLADAGYLSLAPLALAALVVFARQGTTVPKSLGRPRLQALQLVLDGLLIVVSLFLVTWATALGATVRTDQPGLLAFAVAISYPITDLTLVAIVLLIYTTRTIGRQHLRQLSVLGLGLVGLSLSDSVFTYYVSTGAEQLPLAGDLGFVFGPFCIAAAAAMHPQDRLRIRSHGQPRSVSWIGLLAPYLPLAVATGLLGIEGAAGRRIDGIESWAAILILALVTARQGVAFAAGRHRATAPAKPAAFRAVVAIEDVYAAAGDRRNGPGTANLRRWN
jgi:hypothetical protein